MFLTCYLATNYKVYLIQLTFFFLFCLLLLLHIKLIKYFNLNSVKFDGRGKINISSKKLVQKSFFKEYFSIIEKEKKKKEPKFCY